MTKLVLRAQARDRLYANTCKQEGLDGRVKRRHDGLGGWVIGRDDGYYT
jgi:hypothetical protein